MTRLIPLLVLALAGCGPSIWDDGDDDDDDGGLGHPESEEEMYVPPGEGPVGGSDVFR